MAVVFLTRCLLLLPFTLKCLDLISLRKLDIDEVKFGKFIYIIFSENKFNVETIEGECVLEIIRPSFISIAINLSV